ncbi:hypothetical protein CVO74_16790 [Xanthomonas prunicola]|nr:hypothetical protein XpruCFBP8353_15760 [Xanthomonas prunicola]PKV20379.1 hypothetical protein CVO74_16790 [Xanthomonas prunicola]
MAASTPPSSLQGRPCSASCDGERARALQPCRRCAALRVIYRNLQPPWQTPPSAQSPFSASNNRLLR